MKTQFTPGPWEVYCDPQGVHVGFQNDLGFGAVCTMRDRLDIDHANARLIAAAPDMLEALNALDHYFTDLLSQIDNSALDNLEKARCGHCAQINNAREILAKAKGE